MSSPAAPHGEFQKIGTYRNLGGVPNALVGPGPTPGSQRYYLNYMYVNNTIDLVAVDPATGEARVYPNPAPTEYGAWGLIPGDDGCLYVGTLPHAHLLRLNPRTGAFDDLGRPSTTEQYIWNLAVGADHKIYGCTYPSAKLVRYDPATGMREDLGRMDPTEQYARFLAAGLDGYIYIGIGTSRMNIVAYHIATGVHQAILPEADQTAGIANVFRTVDGQVYGQAGSHVYHLQEGQAHLLPAGASPPHTLDKQRLADGRTIAVVDQEVVVTDPGTGQAKRFAYSYPGQALTVFRLGVGPEGQIYGSGILPSYFFHLDPHTTKITTYGLVGGGESYTILAREGKVLLGNYAGDAPLMVFDPMQPYKRGAVPDANPARVTYAEAEGSWRPMAMILGGDGNVYIGAVAPYGKLGGPLTIWDPRTNHVRTFEHLIEDESVVSLAWSNGLIYGGTTIGGGGGAHTTQTDATLFVFDPRTHTVLFKTKPVPGAGSINDLIAAGGKIYGFAGKTLFAFDPTARKVIRTLPSPFHDMPYNSIALGPDGLIWGLASEGVFTIDPKTDALELVATAPEPIRSGFVLQNRALYYASDSAIYRYSLP